MTVCSLNYFEVYHDPVSYHEVMAIDHVQPAVHSRLDWVTAVLRTDQLALQTENGGQCTCGGFGCSGLRRWFHF